MKSDAADYPIRLNRYLASCGVASRRGADEMIAAGRVTVDGEIVTALGAVLSGPADVRVDGAPAAPARQAYFAMNKPIGVVCAVSDKFSRTVLDIMPPRFRPLGLFPVGRLDKESEGLLILTNDGEFANTILHPSFGVTRTYFVKMARRLGDGRLRRWRAGLEIDDGEGGRKAVRPIAVEPEPGGEPGRDFRVTLGEGVKREIRMMARELGNRVASLRRIAIGKFFLENLPVGAFCEYNREEIAGLISMGGSV